MPTNTSQLLDTLRRVPLFNDLSAPELTSIAGRISVSRHSSGEVLFSEGERGGNLLIIQEGTVKIVKLSTSGRQQLIAIERPGSSLGEVSVFDRGPYSTTAITITPTVLLKLDGEHFRTLCLAQPSVALKVIGVLGHRLRQSRRLIEELSFATVRDRLIAHLLHLAAERGTETSCGIEVELSENNEELAARFGTVRELVSRNLGRLHGEGLIIMRRIALTIPSVTDLSRELAG
jgi:CRP/FNR family transcriptional regulator